MASSSEEYTVPESRNENPVWTEPSARHDEERPRSFSRIRARSSGSRGPMVPRHWLRTRLETQAVVSVNADYPA